MACACRASLWGCLVRGIAQFHVSEATAATKLQSALCGLQGTRLGRQGRIRTPGAQMRTIFSSLPMRSEAAAAAEGRDAVVEQQAGIESENQALQVSEDAKAAPSTPSPKPKKPRKAKNHETADTRPRPDGKASTKPSKAHKASEASKAPKKAKATTEAPPPPSPPPPPPHAEPWQAQKDALARKFPLGWNPRKKLSPDALAGIRALHAQFPDVYTTAALARRFEVSPEAVRRILKSRWLPTAAEEEDRRERWRRRGVQIWERKAAMGFKPSAKWRAEGVRRPPGFHRWRDGVRGRVEGEERRVREERGRRRAERLGGADGWAPDGEVRDEEVRNRRVHKRPAHKRHVQVRVRTGSRRSVDKDGASELAEMSTWKD